jgi:FlaA1/EpsC-like NDP-sugar epimerase
MKVLVTGGAGFIGSQLCERPIRQGHHVICLDNFFTVRRENVRRLTDSGRFELVRHDVCEPLLLQVEQIYSLASPASPVHYQYHPVKTVKSNVMGTLIPYSPRGSSANAATRSPSSSAVGRRPKPTTGPTACRPEPNGEHSP